MSRSESEIQEFIAAEAPKHGALLLRNNSGAFYDSRGIPVRYGLGNTSKDFNTRFKSSDLIGITPVVITPEMVGQTIGVFTAIEVKKPGWKRSLTDKREQAQANFIEWVKSKGAFAGFVQSVNDYLITIKKI